MTDNEPGTVSIDISSSLLSAHSIIESFNGKLRDECLNEHWFTSLEDARKLIESWREEYNNTGPHSSLNNIAPMQYVEHLRALGVG